MVVCKFFQQGHCRFGQSCRFEHIYGSKYTYRAPQSENENLRTATSNKFGSNASSLFRSAVQNTSTFNNAPNNSIFGQSSLKPSVFSRLGNQNTVFGANNQAKSIFAQANQNVFQQNQQTNVFHTENQAKSIFSQATQNVFGPPPPIYGAQNTAASIFSSAAHKMEPNIFDSQMNSTPPLSNSVFKISIKPVTNEFGVFANGSEQTTYNEEGIYSKVEDLSQLDIKAFESMEFKLGFIPELPPPKSLCV